MKHNGGLGAHLLSATRGLLYLLVFLSPLFFLPFTLEPLELNKQTLLLLLTFAAALTWIGSMLARKKFERKRGWVNALPILFLVAYVIPSIYSIAPYVSWVGVQSQEYTAFLTIAAGAVLIYLLTNVMDKREHHRKLHTLFAFSAVIAGLVGVLSVYGVSLPFEVFQTIGANTVGTLSSLTVYLTIMSIFLIAGWVSHHDGDSFLYDGLLGAFDRLSMHAVSLMAVFFLVLIADQILWMIFVISLALLFSFAIFKTKDLGNRSRLWWPAILMVFGLIFALTLPQIFTLNIPLEVSPSHETSSIVAERALEEYSPTYGSGPGTYTFDYARFHSAEVNETDFWNTRFSQGSSHLMTLLPTIGILGVILITLFVVILLLQAFYQVVHPKTRGEWLSSFVHLCPWLTLVISGLFVPWSMTLTILFFILSGLLASELARKTSSTSFSHSRTIALTLSFLFMIGSVIFLVGIFFSAQRYWAEVSFSEAVRIDRSGGELEDVVVSLDRAATLNRLHDTYYRNLGEVLLLRVNEELESVGAVETLTAAESSQYIQSLVAAAINASVYATELSAYNPQNWINRGYVYRELIVVMAEAREFAIDAYVRATELEPINPSNWTELGKTYLAAADAIEPLIVAGDVNIAEQASLERGGYLQAAESAFTTAIEHKAGYAPAHFQLGLTYQKQGRIDDAVEKLKSVAQYNPFDVGAFFQLGVLYLNRDFSGDILLAQEAFEYVIQLAPSYANAHWYLASIYEKQGDLASAVKEVEAVLALNPDNQIVIQRLDRLLTGQVSDDLPETIEE